MLPLSTAFLWMATLYLILAGLAVVGILVLRHSWKWLFLLLGLAALGFVVPLMLGATDPDVWLVALAVAGVVLCLCGVALLWAVIVHFGLKWATRNRAGIGWALAGACLLAVIPMLGHLGYQYVPPGDCRDSRLVVRIAGQEVQVGPTMDATLFRTDDRGWLHWIYGNGDRQSYNIQPQYKESLARICWEAGGGRRGIERSMVKFWRYTGEATLPCPEGRNCESTWPLTSPMRVTTTIFAADAEDQFAIFTAMQGEHAYQDGTAQRGIHCSMLPASDVPKFCKSWSEVRPGLLVEFFTSVRKRDRLSLAPLSEHRDVADAALRRVEEWMLLPEGAQ